MLSRPPEIPTPADGPSPEIGTPSRARYSARRTSGSSGTGSSSTGSSSTGASPVGTAGRHRRAGSPTADKFLVEIPTPRRPMSLADMPAPYDADDAGHHDPTSYDPTSYDPAPYDPAPYDPAPHDPAPFTPAPFAPAFLDSASSSPSPYDREPHESGRGAMDSFLPYEEDIPLYDSDDSGPYRAAFLTDDLPFSRPAPIPRTPRYRTGGEPFRAGDSYRSDSYRSDSYRADSYRADSYRADSDDVARDGRRLTPGRRRARQPSAWDKASDAASHSLSIVVRSLPAQRGGAPLPAARRLAGNVRDWAMSNPAGPPVTGTHRAPGTVPLESWLLIGRHRQQALLGALVAIGVMLVMIPGQRQADDFNATNASDRSVATVGGDGRATGGGGRTNGQAEQSSSRPSRQNPPQQQAPLPQPTDKPRPVPSQSLPADEPSPADASAAPVDPDPEATDSGVSPDAHGPARSLRRTGTTAVALTFDDGPDPTTTPKLLKLLADHQVKATFCLVGERALAHPELVQQIVAAGHTLCNHSWDHSFKLGSASTAAMRKDLDDTDAAIHAAVPDVAIPYFRAPGGIFTERLVAVATETQKKSLYWEVDPRDWDHNDDKDDAAHIDRVISAVEKDVKPGSIVLSHDFNQPDTIKAYETLLPYLTEKYELGLP